MTTETKTLTYDHIVALALERGFKLKPQVDGRMALNDYVIDFARAVYDIGHAAAIDTLRAQLAEAQAALKTVMRNAELSKEPCGSDPDSPAAIRNGKFAGLASIAAQGLGMVRGPSLTEQLVEARRNAERWDRAAQCARLDQFGGFVVTPDEPAFASEVSLAFIREIDAAIGAAKESA